ncbi:hypothetical protein ASU31_02785 [Pedobacter ginsenosidimutans]|uniref:Uncharacterized protein n=1 Tax=Pedobacter ginsenosidimutans TaxID=687842 RepID=A0A0T5VUQ6_9SPHI|nr:hypothetical protein [Pedobacter ginsenosidimutans]KRT17487.1 hypothetical protein ASU31_02785 [Pedobacter ginsenosidimutans]
MKFCVLAKISKRTVSFWYQSDSNPYAPLKMKESNEIPLYFYVNGNDFIFGAAARERFYKNDPHAYGNYFEITKDPSKHFIIYGNKKPVKQLFYYGIEQYLSHFLNTVLYKADSIESYRQQFPLRFLFDDDIEDNEKSLIETLFQEAGYFNLDRVGYNHTLFNILAQKQVLPNNKAILLMNGIDDVLYLKLYKNIKADVLGSAKLVGQGADPRVKILADMIVEYIILQNSYLSINKENEISFLLPFCAGLLQNINPIINGEAELSDGNRYWFNIKGKNLNDRLHYYANDGMIFRAIDDLLKVNNLSADNVMILLGSEEINTLYFSEKLLKKYHHVVALRPLDVKDTMQSIFQEIASINYSVKIKAPTAAPVITRPPLPTPKPPPPLPPKKESGAPKSVNIPKLPELKVPQSTKNNSVKPPPLPPKKS